MAGELMPKCPQQFAGGAREVEGVHHTNWKGLLFKWRGAGLKLEGGN